MDINEYRERDYQFIEKILDEKLKPIYKILDRQENILYGANGMSGLIKDLNDIKSSFNFFKWISTIFISFLTLIITFFKNLKS